ncbi:MAG: ERCC4 domain-containing protein [Clostridia bacterium]|nr:ERCC4 domain-containing protein [Clostridia bacterium]
MDIQIDSREKAKAIQKILAEFDKQGITYDISKLIVGDYMNFDNPRLIIDRKQNLSEVYGNLCQGHKRFVNELVRANRLGIHLIVLIEHGGQIKTLEDVKQWDNPRLKKSPYAWDGERLYNVMLTMQGKYGIEFKFCDKRNTGKKILELLQ